ncbi:Nif11-like leader peptide family natural product precursor [Saccharopolyspora gloriosae]|uniref:Nif11-like leader peptide family natural product precursor n=1 Tax=Saccharopolyspora gloriosae TaxID=455344 RepID=UPI001FB5E12E|nr:Nif11-like leader peptide family natural product precursor [Saccharopolyspora gloriosae]
MSVESCKKFLQATQDRPELAQQLKAATGMGEIVALGGRHGFEFTARDLIEGSTTFAGGPARRQRQEQAPPRSGTAFYHHEYELADVPALAPLIDELPRLELQPTTVDMAAFRAEFREDDLRSTSDSPADPEFQAWHQRMAAAQWRDGADSPRRDFHLVNLDEHVDHPGYADYFDAKTRVIDLLEGVFGDDVRFSGSLWYPPSSYRLWHTNENQPGWRMYVVDLDDDFADGAETSFFRYQNPETGEIVTLPERRRIVRFFKTEQDPEKLFWHCIVNPTIRHRWSFGFAVPEDWQARLENA